MALKIRLARTGAKKRPFYRIVVADVRAPRDGRFIEKLGIYNPLIPVDSQLSEKEIAAGRVRIKFDEERIKFWISRGAKPTDRVQRFLEVANILPSDKVRQNPNKSKPKAKAQQRAQEVLDKAKAAEEAKKAEVEAAEKAEAEAAEVKPAENKDEASEVESETKDEVKAEAEPEAEVEGSPKPDDEQA